jgi:hypothetical protein
LCFLLTGFPQGVLPFPDFFTFTTTMRVIYWVHGYSLTVGRLFNQRDFPAFPKRDEKVLIRNDTYCRVFGDINLCSPELNSILACVVVFSSNVKVPAALEI